MSKLHELVARWRDWARTRTQPERLCIRACADDLAAALAETGWRPIDTAPRTGKPLLGFVPSYYQGSGGICVIVWDEGDGEWWDNQAFKTEPTHWMPLPPPPAEEPGR